MPNKKYTYTITTADGKSHDVSKENIDKYGMKAYADAYKGATVRMRDKDNGDYDIPIEHYDDAVGQGLHPFTIGHNIVQQQSKPTAQSTPTAKPATQQPAQQPAQQGKPMTEAQKRQAMNFAAGLSARAEDAQHRFDNQMEYLQHNRGLFQKPAKQLGQNRKVTPIKQADGTTTFVTETGNEYANREMADNEQNTIDNQRRYLLDPIRAQLEDAYAERDRLSARMGELGKEEDKKNDTPLAQLASASNVTGGVYYNDELSHKRDLNDEYRQLHAAAEQNRQRIVALEAERDKASAGFWRGAADAIKSPTIWDFGYTDAISGQALLSASDRKKRKSQAEQEADQELLGETVKNEYAQNEYAANRKAMYRFGQIGATSIPFMAQFMLMGGADIFATAGAKMGINAAVKLGMEGLKKTAMKYTGMTLAELAASNVMANTMQAGTTGLDIVNRGLGQVEQDENGNYQFTGGDDWATAIYKGETAATLENYSEMMFGGSIKEAVGKGLAKGLDKIGLSSINKFFTRIGSSKFAQAADKVLTKSGMNGYGEEVAEEEANIILNSILVGDNKMSDLIDGRTQLDIWGGLLFSVGAMEAVPKAMGAADYFRNKRRVNKADKAAEAAITPERWQPLRDQIDQASNEDFASVAADIIDNPDLNQQERQAALNYMGQLVRFRGYNTASSTNAQEKAASGEQTEEDAVEQGRNSAYMQGHEASDEQKNDIKTRYEYTQQQMRQIFGLGENDDIDEVMNRVSPVEMINELRAQNASEEQLQTALDYYNAQAAYNGMLDGVRENMEDAVEESNQAVDSRAHNDDGMIHPATMKVQDENGNDRKVYVIGGHIQMMDDGTMVDAANSDESIIIRDAETGEIEFADPKDVLSVDEPLDAEEEKQAAAEAIRQQFAQREGDMIDGVLPFNIGDDYSIVDEQGQTHTVHVNGVVVDEQGQIVDSMVSVTIDGQFTTMPKEQIQQMSDAENLSRLSASLQQRAAAQQQQQQEQQAAATLPFALNDEFTLRTADGRTVRGSVQSEVNDDGLVEVYTEEPIDGTARVTMLTPEQLQGMVTEYNGEAYEQPQASPSGAAAEETVGDGELNATQPTATPANSVETPQQEQQQPMPMVKDENGEDTEEPDFYAAEPSRTHSYIYNEAELSRKEADDFVKANAEAAKKALEKLQKKQPKMGTSISQYKAAKAALADELNTAQQQVDYWNAVKAEQDKVIATERAAQAEKDKALHDAAVAEEQQRKEAEAQAAAAREAVGNENPMPHICEKWNAAPKVDGVQDEIVLTNGERVKGHYVLTESGAATPSHQSTNGFQKSEGFPMDENGNTVNDRDYERDSEAQDFTRNIASQYDSRALQTPVVVSQDGVVLSGNGRTMAGELAARDNSDAAYNEYLKQYAQKYGFTPEQVGQMQHPRVVFVPDERMPYTADTFSKFNQNDMKSQSKTEQSVKLGKVVDDGTFNRILHTINAFDTLGDFYNDKKAATEAITELQKAGVVTPQQLAEMFDGDGISAVGREMLENTLIGKAFESNPDAVRMITKYKGMRQSVITALSEIANNVGLGKEYSLEDELAKAVELCYNARQNGYNYGEKVSNFARQTVLFGEEGETLADYQNATIMMLADVLNDQRTTQLKKTLAVYNHNASESAGGQMDIFSGGVKSKEDILKDVLSILNYGTNEQQQSALAGAVEQRKADAAGVQQNGDAEQGNQGSGEAELQGASDAGVSEHPLSTQDTQSRQIETSDPRTMSDEEKRRRGDMLLNAHVTDVAVNQIVATKELSARKAAEKWWDEHVLEPVFYDTEVGEVEISKASIGDSLAHKYGQTKLDAITSLVDGFENAVYLGTMPDSTRGKAVQDHYFAYPIKYDGERCYVFCRAMQDVNKNRLYVHEVFVAENIKKGDTLQTAASQPHGGVSLYRDILANVLEVSTSDGKGTENSVSEQENTENSASATASAIQQAEQQVDTNPTEAQKEAGNYKKGHVKVDGYDITIEQPKGSVRKGTDKDGKAWESEMHNTYGYIRGTEGTDGDHIDVFLSDNPEQGNVYVIDQVDPKTGKFDEHKVMYGFNSMEEARDAYLSNYEKGWKGLGAITEVSKEEFKKWIDSSHRKTKPFAEYKSVKPIDNDETLQPRFEGYTIEKRKDTRDNSDLYAVKFDARVSKEEFKGQKGIAKQFGGYWSNFGKKGFLFKTEEDAHDFADAVLGRSKTEVADEAPLSLADMQGTSKPASNVQGNVQAETETTETTEPKQEAKPTNPSGNKLVTDERYAALRERMRKKLGGQMNMGIDPEILSIGTEMAVYHIEKGARKFVDYAKAMIDDLGDVIRPYLKAFYNGARDLPEMEELAKDMTPYDEVSSVDTANFDKAGAKDLIATAETITKEQEVQRQQEEAEEQLKAERNAQRKAKQDAIEAEAKRRGLKRGDRVLYKRMDGKDKWEEATITDFGGGVDVTLDTGLAPVMYEAAEFDQVKPLPKAEKSQFERWKELKAKHPDALLLFRVGDFYEIYNEDAQKAGEILGLALTHSKNSDFDSMAGFPSHALDTYLPKLVRAGQRVAICDQLDEPKVKKQTKQETPKKETVEPSEQTQEKPTKEKKSEASQPKEPSLFDNMEDAPVEVKPAEELTSDSEEYQNRAAQERVFANNIAKTIAKKASSQDGPMTMSEVRKLASEFDTLVNISTTDLQELVEMAMTKLMRSEIYQGKINGHSEKEIFDRIVALYNTQPLLNARDSTRVERQQYSTPTPFGYVMGQFVKAGKDIKSMREPSAGNGALTIAFDPKTVHVNDIDERRLANLRQLRFGKVTSQDGLLPFEGEQVDAMLTNPPFGTTTEKEFDGGLFKINSLEGLMAINGLDGMKDDGRAAIVIGGNTEYRENGVMKPKDMKFFGYLYSHYHVVDVINLDGAMYARNGTKYPVRIILIDGRKTGEFQRVIPPVKAKARAEQVHTFDELYNRVQDDIQLLQQQPQRGTVSGDGQTAATDNGSSTQSGTPNNPVHTGDGGKPVRPSRGSEAGRPAQLDGKPATPERGSDEQPAEHQPSTQLDHDDRGDGVHSEPVRRTDTDSGSSTGRGGLLPTSERPAERPDTERGRLAVNLGDEKVAYPNRSQSGTLTSVVPAAQAQVLADSLEKIGDVDQYLVDQLGYSSKEELFSHLAAEQVDGVALAINQMGNGNAFIIGDMTGVGKGRQAAALIRYAVKQGKKPIFFTQKPTLFSDMYRDLCDIGSTELRPFILASRVKEVEKDENGDIISETLKGDITDAEGNIIYAIPSDKVKKRVMQYINEHGTLPDEYDYMVTTYSQIQNGTMDYEVKESGVQPKAKNYDKKGVSAGDLQGQKRRDAIEKLSRSNYMILDESHSVSGQSGMGGYMQMLIQKGKNSVAGVTFLSATFAKRADNMPLYSMRTAMSESGLKTNELVEAVARGGVTLQEIMSKQLVQSGQMIRRERDFKGVNIDWMQIDEKADKKQRAAFDEVASIFSAIRDFQTDFIKPLVNQMSEDIAETGAYSNIQRGTEEMGVKNTPFASKMYNLVNQLLFALKADAVADRVIWNLQHGFKPVISFTNTMEGFLKEAPQNVAMDEMPNFSATLQRALDGVMRYQQTDADNNTTYGIFPLAQLPADGQARYNEIRDRIEHLASDLSISPMDAIKMKIEAAGYTVSEITGRKTELTRDADGKYVIRSRVDTDGKAAARKFNNGQLDVLMINKSGSTGISLHSSPKFGDTRQRVMVFAQFQSDINDEVQMRGRIDRTGQKYRGRYEYIMSTIPAEQRLQMMFKAKLKSLDANTTSSQKSKFNEMEVVDFLNKYGDEVVWNYMREHPELEDELGDPLKILASNEDEDGNKRTNGKSDTNAPQSECAAKIARYLAFLPVARQEEVFKDIADAYTVKMQLLNDAGENDLEITSIPLNAETKSKKIWKEGTAPNSGNAFADNTYLEEVEVDVLKKPMKASEVEAYIQRLTSGKPYADWKKETIDQIEAYYNDKAATLKARLDKAMEERAAKTREKYIKEATKSRSNGKNNWTDEEIAHMGDLAAENVRTEAQKKTQQQLDNIKKRVTDLLEKLSDFTPREPLVIDLDITSDKLNGDTFFPSYGTFLGFKFNKDFSPSASTAVFATLDGRRKVEIPLSKENALRKIESDTLMHNYEVQDLNMDTWDGHVTTKARRTAYIVTGNLLQALVDTAKGENTKGYLVSYSTKDGETRQGILMPDRFRPSDLRTSVSISARLDAIRSGETVESEDGSVTVYKQGHWSAAGYFLNVPKSKKSGSIYYTDKTLRGLVEDGEFTTHGNKMRAFVPAENIAKVLDRLSKLGVTVSLESELKDAKDEKLYRTSKELDEEYPTWLSGQTTSTGQHTTQITSTVATYNKIGEHLLSEGKQPSEVSVLDASSGLGVGTKALRDMGFDVEDVEPYPSEKREAPTYQKYEDVQKKYDVVISNAVLNVIPDDWRADVLKSMADKLKVGGRLFINVRDAAGVIAQKQKIELDSPSEILVTDKKGNIRAYQKGFTRQELVDYVKEQLGEDFEVEKTTAKNSGLDGATAVVVTRKTDAPLTYRRFGDGEVTDDRISDENDLIGQILGRRRRSRKQRQQFAERERKRMREDVTDLAEALHISDDVRIVTDLNELEDPRDRKAKGFYDRKTGKITIVLPNHVSAGDAVKTLLHEGVAHYGLRKLFGENFDHFLDNVFNNATEDIRREIVALAQKHNWDFRTATEEYLASLAETTDFERPDLQSWWRKIKDFFWDMLHKLGIADAYFEHAIGDNELRYILWRSYQNLANPGRYRNVFQQAEDIAMQHRLKVGNYAERESEQTSEVAESGKLYRDMSDPEERDRVAVRRAYERVIASNLFQFQEAMQDSMLGLKKLMELILEASGKKEAADFENAYMAENALSSKNKAEADAYRNLVMKPLLDAISQLEKEGASREETTDYMMAKHGLERNSLMAQREFDAYEKEQQAAAQERFKKYQKQHPATKKTWQDFLPTDMKTLADFLAKDYAGLTALTNEPDATLAAAEAQRMVDEFEQKHDTTDLWEKTNAATKATLSKIYESGLLTKDRYEEIRDMYEYYIPLRGWDDTTSDQVYGYLTSKDGVMRGSIMKKAEGRRSKADDPIATIAAMAEAGISQGNRNLMKQKFLNFVLNHPSDAVSVNALWLKYDEVDDEWIPMFADLDEKDDAATVERKVKDFEEKMEQLSAAEPDKYKHGRDAINVPYVVKPGNLNEHQVLVQRGGRPYVITINGNPRAAQALNGMTNPNVELEGAIGSILKAGEWVNRQMSAFYTTRNPNFVASNFIRDALYANSMVWVKESPNYALRFHKNFGKYNPFVLGKLLDKYEKGTLDMNDPAEKMFYQFMMNGGETGYTVQRDVEAHKRTVRKELAKRNSRIPLRTALSLLGERFDDVNRSVENCARFAAFVTSREMGRSVEKSVWDAKEVSVNFNKKGAGSKFLNATGQTVGGRLSAWVSGTGRLGYVFWNAAIQGTYNFGKGIASHPVKGASMLAATFLLGTLIPLLGGDGDGDDDKNYYNLPDFVRRSNICFRVGDKWLTIPLSVELRAMYGLGELASSVMTGNEKLSGEEIGRKIAEQVSQAMPLDFMNGGGGLSAAIPSSVKPVVEAYVNKDWTGLPIYKDTPYNKNMPEWTKTYSRTNHLLINLSKTLNEWSGGDDLKKGSVDLNPAVIEHLLEGTFGGVSTTINQMQKTAETIAGQRDFDWRNIPIASRVVKNADERTKMRAVNDKYFKYLDEYKETERLLKGYENAADEGLMEYAEKLDFLYNSKEYQRYEVMEDYVDYISDLNDEMKEAVDEEERKDIQSEQDALKTEMVEALRALEEQK